MPSPPALGGPVVFSRPPHCTLRHVSGASARAEFGAAILCKARTGNGAWRAKNSSPCAAGATSPRSVVTWARSFSSSPWWWSSARRRCSLRAAPVVASSSNRRRQHRRRRPPSWKRLRPRSTTKPSSRSKTHWPKPPRPHPKSSRPSNPRFAIASPRRVARSAARSARCSHVRTSTPKRGTTSKRRCCAPTSASG